MSTLKNLSTLFISENSNNHEEKSEPLIPGLPDEITELCLYQIPYPHQAQSRSVSSSWNKAISNPSFLHTKNLLSLSLPYLFVFSFHNTTAKIQWQAMGLRSGQWVVLPPMPCPQPVCPPSFACASVPRDGKLYVMGGMRSDTGSPMQTMITYHTSTNQWYVSAPMWAPRAFFTGVNINGKIIVFGGNGVDLNDDSISTVELYDPKINTWKEVANMRYKLGKYDAAVVGSKLYVTEGWRWPFTFSPRGEVYDLDDDTWREMSDGMREGWTGMSVVLGDRIFVISEHAGCQLKVYQPDDDTWQFVGGEKFPCEALHKPYGVSGVEGMIYVVSSGLNLGIGRVFEEEIGGKLWVEWKVVESPKAFHEFSPSNCLLLYA